MKRRIIVFALLASMLLTLTACTKTDDTAASSSDVVLGEYKNLEVTLLDLTVTEQDVMREMYATLVDYATDVTDETHTTIQQYDVANVDFEGLLDGVAFDGGTSTDYDMVVGASGFIDGFDEGLLGVAVGDTVSLDLTFPEDYSEATLAGQAVVFNVTVNSLKEITDDVVAANTDYTTLADYTAYYTDYLNEQAESSIETQKENDLLDQIVASSTITTDHSAEITEYVDYYTSYYESYATNYYSIDLETFLNYMYGMTTEEFTAELTSNRETSLKYMDVLLAIADKEGLEITDDEYNEGADEMMRTYSYDTIEALEEAYTKEAIIDSLLCDKAMQIVLDNCVVVEN